MHHIINVYNVLNHRCCNYRDKSAKYFPCIFLVWFFSEISQQFSKFSHREKWMVCFCIRLILYLYLSGITYITLDWAGLNTVVYSWALQLKPLAIVKVRLKYWEERKKMHIFTSIKNKIYHFRKDCWITIYARALVFLWFLFKFCSQ
jgi:hypothetical protein